MPEITKKDQLDWLDMQRDAVNTEIVYAAPDEKKQYHKNLQIINAIEVRMKEMTAVEYLEAFREIADTYCSEEVGCGECPFGGDDFSVNVLCTFDETAQHPRRVVEIVKKWKEERDEQG